ncbi:hypothetical protein AC578_4962 [Pseudocercospora eumusae]|uniref:Uncharacterized protein n=1 Tax=Pseudocercospora eumusae TaxID=321146 RepID=A0A139HNG0_9PEZI|nr:hypothetical protein AC578_4962 [Pseudocercospora eumusae]
MHLIGLVATLASLLSLVQALVYHFDSAIYENACGMHKYDHLYGSLPTDYAKSQRGVHGIFGKAMWRLDIRNLLFPGCNEFNGARRCRMQRLAANGVRLKTSWRHGRHRVFIRTKGCWTQQSGDSSKTLNEHYPCDNDGGGYDANLLTFDKGVTYQTCIEANDDSPNRISWLWKITSPFGHYKRDGVIQKRILDLIEIDHSVATGGGDTKIVIVDEDGVETEL